MGYKVYFTTHAFVQLLREIEDFTGIETGGIFIGRRIEDSFYIFECVDSGINCEHSEVEFKRDYQYTEHLSYVVASMYEGAKPIGYYHRHPGSYNHFSDGDGTSNKEMARLLGGCISGLVTIFPHFKLNLWYIDLNGQLFSADDYEVRDDAFVDIMLLKKCDALINSIEKNEYEFNVRRGFFHRGDGLRDDPLGSLHRLEIDDIINEDEIISATESGVLNSANDNARLIQQESPRTIVDLFRRPKQTSHFCKISRNMSDSNKRIYSILKPEIKKLSKKYNVLCREFNGIFTIKIYRDNISFNFIVIEKPVNERLQFFLYYHDEKGERQEVLYQVGALQETLKKLLR